MLGNLKKEDETLAEYISGPFLKDEAIEKRPYQLKLFKKSYGQNTLVCLPTGLGKTPLNLLLTVKRLDDVGGRALFVAPTKPLVTQHTRFYREVLDLPDSEVVAYMGDRSPDKRVPTWDDGRIVIATPEVIRNDVEEDRISLEEFSHLTFDECHRASGDYAYVPLARFYHEQAEHPMVTGMSASPGGDKKKIIDVCSNIGASNVEVLTENDKSVREYTHNKAIKRREIELPGAIRKMYNLIHDAIIERGKELVDDGFNINDPRQIRSDEINSIQKYCQKLIGSGKRSGYSGMSLIAQVRKLRTAKAYVGTHSVETFRRYMDRQIDETEGEDADPSQATEEIIEDENVREAMHIAKNTKGLLHPKMKWQKRIVDQTLDNGSGKVIIFTGSRDTVDALEMYLGQDFSDGTSFDVQYFVGQSDTGANEGMKQDRQQEVLDQFHEEQFNVLIATSVAEEGLDVPEVDRVIFHEPAPSAVRDVQRKGRTGRQSEGAVTILMSKDTRDEGFYWKAHHERKEMKKNLEALKEVEDVFEEELAQNPLLSPGDDTPD